MLVILMGGIFCYAVEMDLGAMIYVPSFIKIGLVIQKLIRGQHRHTAMSSYKPTFIFFKYYNKN
jgi:hypothetical protein